MVTGESFIWLYIEDDYIGRFGQQSWGLWLSIMLNCYD